jgi:hypothetical protein
MEKEREDALRRQEGSEASFASSPPPPDVEAERTLSVLEDMVWQRGFDAEEEGVDHVDKLHRYLQVAAGAEAVTVAFRGDGDFDMDAAGDDDDEGGVGLDVDAEFEDHRADMDLFRRYCNKVRDAAEEGEIKPVAYHAAIDDALTAVDLLIGFRDPGAAAMAGSAFRSEIKDAIGRLIGGTAKAGSERGFADVGRRVGLEDVLAMLPDVDDNGFNATYALSTISTLKGVDEVDHGSDYGSD